MRQKQSPKYFQIKGFYILSIFLILSSFLFQSPIEIIRGFYQIMLSPSNLLTDFMAVGGIGAAFFNSGFILLISLIFIQLMKARLTGALVASLCTVVGFSFFGKNLINSFPLSLGVILYAKFEDIELSHVMHIFFFSTGIAPIVSVFIFALDLPLYFSFPLGIAIGVIIGFFVVPLSTSMLHFHQGYNLYNVGFTLGIIGLAVISVLDMFGINFEANRILYQGDDRLISMLIIISCLFLVLYGLYLNRGIKGYKKLLHTKGRLLSDFIIEFPNGIVLVNMGLVGLMGLFFAKISFAVINGPIVGAIFTMIGFAALGKHPKNIFPILLGVYISTFFNIFPFGETESVLVALFGTTLAPIAGQFGFMAGVLAGFVHNAIAMNVGVLHSGVNLYNNGLSGGFVAGLFIPFLQLLHERKENRV